MNPLKTQRFEEYATLRHSEWRYRVEEMQCSREILTST